MAGNKNQNAKQLQGIIRNLSGQLDDLVVKSNGVIYMRKPASKKRSKQKPHDQA